MSQKAKNKKTSKRKYMEKEGNKKTHTDYCAQKAEVGVPKGICGLLHNSSSRAVGRSKNAKEGEGGGGEY